MPYKDKQKQREAFARYLAKPGVAEKRRQSGADWRARNGDRQKEKETRRRLNKRAQCLVANARTRARKRGIPFALDGSVEDIQARIDAGRCEVTGAPFDLGSGRTWNSPSLDRIDPAAGYVPGNVRVVCHAINAAMGDWGEGPVREMVSHWTALAARQEEACGPHGTGEYCEECEPIATPPASGEAVLTHPARVAGRDFMPGEPVQRVLGRAHAHYDVTHASGEAGADMREALRKCYVEPFHCAQQLEWAGRRCPENGSVRTALAEGRRVLEATPPPAQPAEAVEQIAQEVENLFDGGNDGGDARKLADRIRRLAAVAPAGMDDESGWREALQRVADEWGIDFGGAEAFFLDALRLWKPNKTHLLIHHSELIEGDSYGVYGSDFYRCKLCGAESGAGVLNKGIPHDSSCYLATPPATAGQE